MTGACRLDSEGWLPSAKRIDSPNFDARPVACEASLLVVHYISLPPGKFGGDYVEQLFTNRLEIQAHPYFEHLASLRVSAHFFIGLDGRLTQFVSTKHRAWHAGVSRYRDLTGVWHEKCNDFSIGVELEGDDEHAFTQKQYRRLASLAKALRKSSGICAITGHEDIAVGRKFDPGPRFDWQRFVKSIESCGPWYRFQAASPR